MPAAVGCSKVSAHLLNKGVGEAKKHSLTLAVFSLFSFSSVFLQCFGEEER